MIAPEVPIDPDEAWRALCDRDRRQDGCFVFGVASTGVYCRPSCPARRPARDRVRFFADGAAARRAGFRACLRCRPDEAARDALAVQRAALLLDEEPMPSVETVAAAVGYSPSHLIRIFRLALGITPSRYARARRAARARIALGREDSVTHAIYAAGYDAPSRFYADSTSRLGMKPAQWRKGGAGIAIRWATVRTSLGTLLVGATPTGICRIAFDEGEADLRALFPRATITPMGEEDARLLASVVALVETPRAAPSLPLDVRGTAFQEAIWQALTRIAPGSTVSYAELAVAAGRSAAVRAAGSACAANPVALLIPCHRVVRGDGGLGGYAWGLDRKAALLEREAVEPEQGERERDPE